MVDIKIMAVLARKHEANSIKSNFKNAKIIYDDRGFSGGGDAWYNAKRCWTDPSSLSATHRLVLQDDVILCNDFMTYVNACVRFNPEAVWSFYVGWKAEQTFHESDTPFLRVRGCKTGAPAILMPIYYPQRMIEETDYVFGESYKHDDSRIGWWCAYNGIPLMTTNPQIVQHSDIKSVLNHNAKRYSRTFRQDVSGLNWDRAYYEETKLITPWLWTEAPRAVSYCKIAKDKEKRR